MQVGRNRVVYMEYRAWNERGELVETTEGNGAFAYLHGRGNILPGLEAALEGAAVGDTARVTLTAEQAYGERVAEACVTVPRGQLAAGVRGELGERVQIQGPDGIVEFTITALDGDAVTLDANHPLAGQALTFEVEVTAVRMPHKDEVRHKRLHHAGHHLMVSDSSRFDDD